VLSTNGVFHRDICLENILLGFDDDGWRGVLIDLGMAIKTGRQISEICKDFKSVSS
jgi:serine/threonine protein kinase